MPSSRSTGFTLIEVIIVAAVFGIIILALTVFVGRAFTVSREHVEQVRIVEDARHHLERMSDAIRSSSFVDCDGDGFTNGFGEHWLQDAQAEDISVFTNLDDDDDIELVRYYIDPFSPGDLKRTISDRVSGAPGDICTFGETSDVVLLRTLRNDQTGTPLFTYHTSGRNPVQVYQPTLYPGLVERVRMHLQIDYEEAENPEDLDIFTDVAIRNTECDSTNCGVYACSDPGFQATSYDATLNDYAETGLNECMSHCATNTNIPAGACCSWSAGWAYNPVTDEAIALCSCQRLIIPPALPKTTVDPLLNEYTTFIDECLDGTTCGGPAGVPLCEPGCLDGPGECACQC